MTTALTELHGIHPIGLDELNTRASLLVRMDRKYLVPDSAVTRLMLSLPAGTRALEIEGQRQIGYRSLYHDTNSFDAYKATATRRRRRFKVRTREYGTGGCYLEVKTRRGSYTVKERIERDAVCGHLDQDAMSYVVDRLDCAGIPLTAALEPTLWTSYWRSTLLLADDSRLTIDKEVSWRLGEVAGPAGIGMGNLSIVETKAGRNGSLADRILWAAGIRPVSVSKYGTGLAALRPDLPSNRWHRIITHRLGVTQTLTGAKEQHHHDR